MNGLPRAGLSLLLATGCAAHNPDGPDSRLTPENLNALKPGVSQQSDVRGLLGAPHAIENFPRLQRQAWSYRAQGIQPQLIVVQFSSDGILREAYMIDDPDFVSAAE